MNISTARTLSRIVPRGRELVISFATKISLTQLRLPMHHAAAIDVDWGGFAICREFVRLNLVQAKIPEKL